MYLGTLSNLWQLKHTHFKENIDFFLDIWFIPNLMICLVGVRLVWGWLWGRGRVWGGPVRRGRGVHQPPRLIRVHVPTRIQVLVQLWFHTNLLFLNVSKGLEATSNLWQSQDKLDCALIPVLISVNTYFTRQVAWLIRFIISDISVQFAETQYSVRIKISHVCS